MLCNEGKPIFVSLPASPPILKSSANKNINKINKSASTGKVQKKGNHFYFRQKTYKKQNTRIKQEEEPSEAVNE